MNLNNTNIASFIRDLQSYIESRSSEGNKNSIFGFYCKDEKISVSRKLISFLEGEDINFLDTEVSTIRNGRLGDICRKFAKSLGFRTLRDFLKSTKVREYVKNNMVYTNSFDTKKNISGNVLKKTKEIFIRQIWVDIGNGKGRFTNKSKIVNNVLFTTDLDTCTGIALINNSYNFLMHSDEVSNTGQGRISLQDALKKTVFGKHDKLEIFMVGGDDASREIKGNIITSVFSNSKIYNSCTGGSVYVTAEGRVCKTGEQLKELLNTETLNKTHVDKWDGY